MDFDMEDWREATGYVGGGDRSTLEFLARNFYWVVWATFYFAIVATPEDVDKFWNWVQHLEFVPHACMWIFCLPYMLATAVWVSDLDVFFRVIIVLAVPFLALLAPGAARRGVNAFLADR